MTRFLCALLALVLPGLAAARLHDYSDHWFNPANSGWGLQLEQHDESAYALLYTYGADGSATWYVSADLHVIAYNSGGQPALSGTLTRVRRPPGGGALQGQTVGTLDISPVGPDSARAIYTLDGVEHDEPIQRMAQTAPDLAGEYFGAFALRFRTSSGAVPTMHEFSGTLRASLQEGPLRFSGRLIYENQDCLLLGETYRQNGRTGAAHGSLVCNGVGVGQFDIESLVLAPTGMTGYLRLRYADGAERYGNFAAARR